MPAGRPRRAAGGSGPHARRRRHVRRIAPQQEPDPDVRRPDDGAGLRGGAVAPLSPDLPPSALSVHFIAGGDPEQDLEFHVVRLRDERRFANRRVDVVQDGVLLATAMVSYLSTAAAASSTASTHRRCQTRCRCPRSTICSRGYEETVPHVRRGAAGPSNGATPTTRPG